ncbi:MAG: hypothetical protein IPJ74_26820 [Saprospiraceae bacterium]|nr:hypothetical protein [Saprospiraceae bacterium]
MVKLEKKKLNRYWVNTKITQHFGCKTCTKPLCQRRNFHAVRAPSAIGSEGILKSYEFIFSQIQLNIEFFIDEILVEGDFAFATTSSKGTTLIHANGETIPEENRELFVLKK